MSINFSCLVEIVGISEREKEDGTKYAVIKATFTARGRFCTANLICFTESLYSKLKEKVWYAFEGNVAVQSGNTFLVITKSEEAFSLPF